MKKSDQEQNNHQFDNPSKKEKIKLFKVLALTEDTAGTEGNEIFSPDKVQFLKAEYRPYTILIILLTIMVAWIDYEYLLNAVKADNLLIFPLILIMISFSFSIIFFELPTTIFLPPQKNIDLKQYERRFRQLENISLILFSIFIISIFVAFVISQGGGLVLSLSFGVKGIIFWAFYAMNMTRVGGCKRCGRYRLFVRRSSGWKCGACGWKFEY